LTTRLLEFAPGYYRLAMLVCGPEKSNKRKPHSATGRSRAEEWRVMPGLGDAGFAPGDTRSGQKELEKAVQLAPRKESPITC